MMLRITLALACCLALSSAAVACLNLYGTDVHGHATDMDGEGPRLAYQLQNVELDLAEWERKEVELRQDLATADYQHRSNYAVALIYLGRYDEAIEILEAVEAEQPGEAIVATNLGTAYELNGNLEKALEWIQTGYERDPQDHEGSEWLHVKILEARIELAKDPNYLETHSVLGLDFGSGKVPTQPASIYAREEQLPHKLYAVQGAVVYQLHERLQFVPPQDPVVADLLFDLGNLVALNEVVEDAIPLYAFAREYGVQNESLLNLRQEYFQSLIDGNPLSGLDPDAHLKLALRVALIAVPIILVLLVAVPIVFVLYRRSARRRAAE